MRIGAAAETSWLPAGPITPTMLEFDANDCDTVEASDGVSCVSPWTMLIFTACVLFHSVVKNSAQCSWSSPIDATGPVNGPSMPIWIGFVHEAPAGAAACDLRRGRRRAGEHERGRGARAPDRHRDCLLDHEASLTVFTLEKRRWILLRLDSRCGQLAEQRHRCRVLPLFDDARRLREVCAARVALRAGTSATARCRSRRRDPLRARRHRHRRPSAATGVPLRPGVGVFVRGDTAWSVEADGTLELLSVLVRDPEPAPGPVRRRRPRRRGSGATRPRPGSS